MKIVFLDEPYRAITIEGHDYITFTFVRTAPLEDPILFLDGDTPPFLIVYTGLLMSHHRFRWISDNGQDRHAALRNRRL